MHTTTSAAVIPDRNPSRTRRVVNRAGLLLAVVVGFLGFSGGNAFAQTADPSGAMFTSLQSSLTGTLIPAASALIVVGIVFALAVKYVKKAQSKA